MCSPVIFFYFFFLMDISCLFWFSLVLVWFFGRAKINFGSVELILKCLVVLK